jgi:anthranilate phosphoribosyltransferase
MFADALKLLGSKRAMIVHGHDGLDEISVCAPTRVSELKDGQIRTFDLLPEQFFGELADPAGMQGGDPAQNADITRRILSGEKSARRNVVALNAAAALVAADKAAGMQAGIKQAEAAIDTGAAAGKLEQLIAYTRNYG